MVRPRSCLLSAALLICLFFYTAAYSEKKNKVYGEDADRDVKIYKANYKKNVAEPDCDIISYNIKKSQWNEDDEDLVEKDIRRDQTVRGSIAKDGNSSGKHSREYVYYIVKKGDTLFSIAKRSGISIKRIQDTNDFNKESKIFKGMKLRIPLKNSENKKYTSDSIKKSVESAKPVFLWPLKKIKGYSRDGKDGVKSIGLIIKGNPGSEVIASENGVVKKVGYMRGYGKYIVVGHDGKYITVYSNLMEVDVKKGDTVKKGGRIGNISDDMTLHFQIDRAGKPENPINYLPKRG